MNLSAQVVGAMQSHGVPTPVINQYTTHVTKEASVNEITGYLTGVLRDSRTMADSVVYLNDVKADESAWFWHFCERVVPFLKTKG